MKYTPEGRSALNNPIHYPKNPDGSKVKAYVFFKGRSILFSEQGEKLLLRFAVELEEFGKAEQMPKNSSYPIPPMP